MTRTGRPPRFAQPRPAVGRPPRRAAAPRSAALRSPALRSTGFTLVEVLIVVVILAILAATVLPQFANASDEATASAVKQNLHVVRSQIELYRVQHNGALPGTYTGVDLTTALTSRTDKSGAVNAASGVYGPYIKRVFPANPANGSNAVASADTTASDYPGGTEGWFYNKSTGEFRAKGDAAYWAW